MVSLCYLNRALETFGLINFHQFKSQRRTRNQSVYTFVTTHLLLFYVLCQCLNVYSRAIRYYPEFIQTLLDNTIMWLLMFLAYFFQSKYQTLLAISNSIDKSFSKADVQVTRRCHQLTNAISLIIIIVVFTGFSGSVLELVLPLSDIERNIRLNIYGANYLDRRLPYIIRVPFLNENKSPIYEILFAFELYILVISTVLSSFSIILVPIILIHIQSQYEILSKYIRMVGQEHRDELGYKIYYTDIESNQYIIKLYSPIIRGTKLMRIKNALEQVRKQKMYEEDYLRQIVKFHQKLLSVQNEVCIFYNVWLYFKIYKGFP
uniref:Odorant receptor n=1 Tax=Cacopsylla melanoneura TaxID=428564 RepID=A0A8D8W6C8_9HEMI